MTELTLFTRANGVLSKRITLGADGKINNEAACAMGSGRAERVKVDGVAGLGELIARLSSKQALALGMLHPDLSDVVSVITAERFRQLSDPPATTITRTAKNLTYRPGQPAFVLFDLDLKGMPDDVKQRVAAHGGYWEMLCAVFPDLAGAGHVLRSSTSAGLSRGDTGQQFPSSGGMHCYVVIKDGADTERFLKTMHDRLWLHGLGWMMISDAGRFLPRSIVDRLVGQPERLVFEGPPIIEPPLVQDAAARRPIVVVGDAVDSLKLCPPLSVAEKAMLQKLQAEARLRPEPERHRVQEAYVDKHAADLAARRGMTIAAAKRVIENRCNGTLLPEDELEFDDGSVLKVGGILDNPGMYDNDSLADPLEGAAYGRGKAYIHVGADGMPWIYSFAHGGMTYRLRYDAAAIRVRLAATSDADLIDKLVRLLLQTDDDSIDQVEEDALVDEVSRRTRDKVWSIRAKIKTARQKRDKQRAEARRERERAARTDPRPQITRPAKDAPLIPSIKDLNDVVASVPLRSRPFRNLDGVVARRRRLAVPNTHAYGDVDGTDPVPEQWVIAALDALELAEALEEHADYVDAKTGRSVTPPPHLVQAFLRRFDGVLPTIGAVATAPIVLGDGAILAQEDGIDVARGIAFAVSQEAMSWVPRREECTREAVRAAMVFLTEDWLCDLTAKYVDKCVVVACALTLIERSLLPDRPVFFMTGGRRSVGKGTTIKMIIKAVTGEMPAMSAWSTDENERRKSIVAYFLAGVASICWDNIERRTMVACPHIERSATTTYYADRRLGVSETVVTSASSIHIFTGNNIAPRGDLASRSLLAHFQTDRADPENRDFQHADPIEWTTRNRGRIMRSLYTILLGNPTLELPRDAQLQTRFKTWWRLIGSAVESAVAIVQEGADVKDDDRVAFRDLFLRREEEEGTDDVDLVAVLEVLRRRWPYAFAAKVVAEFINRSMYVNVPDAELNEITEDKDTLRDFFYGEKEGKKWKDDTTSRVTAKSLTRLLGAHVGNMVRSGDEHLVLRAEDRGEGHARTFRIVATPVAASRVD